MNPRYQWYRHCEVVSAALERVVSGEIRRLMIFEPPRHGKSEQVSRILPAYFLRRHPDRWVAINSYSAPLAYTFSRAARQNYTEDGRKLRDDAGAVQHWETVKGGGLWATGVDGPATGKGIHLGIIDDPLKNAQDAASATIRQQQKDWYQSTFYTRLEPEASAIVLCMTRWSEDDLAGWLLNPQEQDEIEPWHIISLPAIYEEPYSDAPLECTVEPDWRKPGEALCPERYDAERLAKIRAAIGDQRFVSLYQQQPGTVADKGRVYFNFETKNLAPVTDAGGDLYVGLDFNVSPMSAVLGSKVANHLHIWGEVVLDDAGTPEMIEELQRRFPGRSLIAYPDPAGNSRRTSSKAGETDFSLLRQAGIVVRAPSAAPAVVDRVNEVNVLCGSETSPTRLLVNPHTCPVLVRCLRRLAYKPGSGVVDKGKGWDHSPDALGYLVHGLFPIVHWTVGTVKLPYA